MAEMVVWERRWGLGWVSRGVKIRPPLPWTDRQTDRQKDSLVDIKGTQ